MTLSPFDDLPEVYHLLVPELRTHAWVAEPQADCSACVMLPPVETQRPLQFHPLAKCCTFHPSLPNHMVGRALRRGGAGAARIQARMRALDGVNAEFVQPTPGYFKRYQLKAKDFGRDPTLRCPYYAHGNRSCGIWQDRNATCRTWFCKHAGGRFRSTQWTQVHLALMTVERRLAKYCRVVGEAPSDGADLAEMQAWYLLCADLVEAMDADDAMAIQCGELLDRREHVALSRTTPPPELPDVVTPSVRWAVPIDGDKLMLASYSMANGVSMSRSVFVFYSKLDGERPWREALAEAEAEVGAMPTEADVREMWDLGLLRTPEAPPDPNVVQEESSPDGDVVVTMWQDLQPPPGATEG